MTGTKTGYEIIILVKPNLGEDKNKKITENFESWVTKNEGEILELDPWGLRDIATVFNHFSQAYYIYAKFNATNKTLDEINSRIRVTEDIIRYQIITLESIRTVKEETEEEKAKA